MAYYQQQQQQGYYPPQQQQGEYYYTDQQPQQQQYYQETQPQQQYYYADQQPQYQQYDQQQQQVYYQDGYGNYYDANNTAVIQQNRQPDQFIDVSGDPGDTIVLEQRPDGTFVQRRISEKDRLLERSDATQKVEVSAHDAISFVHRERAQEGNANTFDADLIANIATKWNVSPPKERRMRHLVADLDETLRSSERKQGTAAKDEDEDEAAVPGETSQQRSDRESRNKQRRDKKQKSAQKQKVADDHLDDDTTIVIGNVELAPNCQLRAAQHRAATVLAPTRGTGFDKLRMEDRPVPPTEDSLQQSNSEFRTCLDLFKAETSRLMTGAAYESNAARGASTRRSPPRNSSYKNNKHQIQNDSFSGVNAFSGSFDVTDFDQVEIGEIHERERNKDEMAELRDELIRVSNQVIHAHDRLKKEGGKASEATQLVAHRKPPPKKSLPSASSHHNNNNNHGNSPTRKQTNNVNPSMNVSRTSTNVTTTTPKKTVGSSNPPPVLSPSSTETK